MRRALIITYYWPPTGGSGVQRWVKFSKYLPEFGWQPVVYTPENPEQIAIDESLLKDIPEQAEIIKTYINEPYTLARKLMGKGSTQKGSGVNPINSQKKTFKQRLVLWVRSNFFVPDPRVGWVRPSVRYLKKYLKDHPVDVIVTTGPPQSMHLIGLRLHRALGIPWVADFRDPWTKMFYFKHLGLGSRALRRHRELEQEVLDEANAVVAVTPFVQADFQAMTATKVHLITNGFDEDDFTVNRSELGGCAGIISVPQGEQKPIPVSAAQYTETEKSPAKNRIFRVVHTGLFASDGNPLKLWESLAGMRDGLEIRLAGKVDPEIIESIKAAGLGENLVELGYLSHNESVAELLDADLILLPLRQDPEYRKVLPGKIFECLAARKPILGIGQEDGAAAMVLKETGAGVMLDWDKDPSAFIQQVKDGKFTASDSNIEKYTRRNLTAAMVSVFEELL